MPEVKRPPKPEKTAKQEKPKLKNRAGSMKPKDIAREKDQLIKEALVEIRKIKASSKEKRKSG